MKTLDVGQRVTVVIQDLSSYSGGDRFQDVPGVIVKFNPKSVNGKQWLGPAYLVQFDTPVPSEHTSWSPTTAFWFPPDDLKESV